MTQKLIFVYNAKSDIINASFDFAHKILSPKTYNCSICKLNHGALSEKKEWTEFRDNSNSELEFLHIDEFEEVYPKEKYPAVFEVKNNSLELIISPEKLNTLNSVEELINSLKKIAETV
jgi:hypothetical protein